MNPSPTQPSSLQIGDRVRWSPQVVPDWLYRRLPQGQITRITETDYEVVFDDKTSCFTPRSRPKVEMVSY